MEQGQPSTPRPANRLLDPRRLAIGALVVALLLAPVYAFVISEPADATVSAARLLDTPAAGSVSAVGVESGKLAPNFELSAPDGSRHRLADLRGRPLLINFWATWCGSCLSEMPEIKALQQERGTSAFNVLAINAGETRQQAVPFIDFLDAPFIYGLDLDLAVADAYGVYGLPLSVFIDTDGIVRGVYRGHADRPRLEALTAAAIDARPAAEPAPALRTVSTIPRERVLTVRRTSDTELAFSSRSLRCDASFCVPDIATMLREPAIESAQLVTQGEVRLVGRFRRDEGAEARIVADVAGVLANLPDPVYEGPLQVRFTD